MTHVRVPTKPTPEIYNKKVAFRTPKTSGSCAVDFYVDGACLLIHRELKDEQVMFWVVDEEGFLHLQWPDGHICPVASPHFQKAYQEYVNRLVEESFCSVSEHT